MYVNAIEYQVLYGVLCRAVARKYYKGNIKKYHSIDSPQLWKNFPKPEYQRHLAGDSTTSTAYFYRRKVDLNPHKTLGGEVNTKALFNALKYIDLKIPSSYGSILGDSNRLTFLFDLFRKDFKKEILELRQDCIDRQENLHLIVSDLLTKYFKKLSNKKYEDAWQLLTYNYQLSIWNNDLDYFIRFHQNFYGYKLLCVYGAHYVDHQVIAFNALVSYYNHSIESQSGPNGLEGARVKHITYLEPAIKRIYEFLDSSQAEEFNEIPMKDILETPARTIAYWTGVDYSKIALQLGAFGTFNDDVNFYGHAAFDFPRVWRLDNSAGVRTKTYF